MHSLSRRVHRPGRLGLVSMAAIGLSVALAAGALAQSGLVTVRARSEATPGPTAGAGTMTTATITPSAAPSAAASAVPIAAASAEPASGPATYPMPVVPVESFWSVPGSVGMMDLGRLWSGSVSKIATAAGTVSFSSLVVAAGDVAALTRFFGEPAGPGVRALSVDGVKSAVRAGAAVLGLLEADDVTPEVRALSLDGVDLFGSSHLADPSAWRLRIASAVSSRVVSEGVWTLAAGGDVNLDRRVYVQAVTKRMGPDYPWLGGIARLSGYECCNLAGGPIVRARSRNPGEAFRARFEKADLALVNLEGSAPNDFVYRPNSLVFTFDPGLLVGLKNAGIDMVSLANNHIGNGGEEGVLETIANLDRQGIAHAGAGADRAEATKPVWLSAGGGRKVAVLACSAVGGVNWASTGHPGAAPLQSDHVVADIRAAKAAGADVVIVMPHWGQEFSYAVTARQRSQAAAFVAAGADLVLGSHSHWVGGVQTLAGVNGRAFVDYSMGDLMFDLNHDSESLEAEVVTLTFVGRTLAQVQLDPTVLIDGAQVGLLDPATDGKPIIDAIRAASARLGW